MSPSEKFVERAFIVLERLETKQLIKEIFRLTVGFLLIKLEHWKDLRTRYRKKNIDTIFYI